MITPPVTPDIQPTLKRGTEYLRDKLAGGDALPQLALLGLITGVIAGAIIVVFRWAVEIPLGYLLPGSFENFEAISSVKQFLLPLLGASLLGLILQCVDKRHHATSIGHVLDRLQNHQGRMPAGNFANQFFGGAACLLTGQSVGREGPAVHLGAGTGSLLGQWLKLPANALRPLAGCGVAAAIAACFNTPLAGVIFAMEVVLMEYTILGFIPVIIAAVAGATVTRLAFGPEIVFVNAQSMMSGVHELPFVALVGLAMSVFAAAYIHLHSSACRWANDRPIFLRLSLAGFLTGVIALGFPHIMGVGYDTISSAIMGDIGFWLLLMIALAKLFATAVSLGVGMPGGVVGPLLFIGACVGGAVGSLAQWIMPSSASTIGFYVILGMGAMMGATLNAPLAAMVAILELTYNPGILFPSMLVVVAACLCTRWVFKCDGLFQHVLRAQGKYRTAEAMEQSLSRTGVRVLMDRQLVTTSSSLTPSAAERLLSHHPHWILLAESRQLLQPADLAAYLQQFPPGETDKIAAIDLHEIPARRYDLTRIAADANLYEALELMNRQQVDVLWVESLTNDHQPLGIISREKIDRYYRI